MKELFASLLLVLMPVGAARAGERFACDMKALSKDERSRHAELTRTLLATIVEKSEMKSGYGFRFNHKELPLVAEWVGFESRCCPFFTFELELARDRGPLWLRITGSDGVKAFIRAEFAL